MAAATPIALAAHAALVSQPRSRAARRLAKHDRALQRLEAGLGSVQHVVEELPKLRHDVASRTTEVETKLNMELGRVQSTLSARLQGSEKELKGKAASADLRKLALDLEESATKEEIQRIESMIDRVQKEAAQRIDDISERTFSLRREMTDKTNSLQAETDATQKRVEDVASRIEEKSSQVSRVLVKAERALATKVSSEELARTRTQHTEQLDELKGLLLTQMGAVRERADESVGGVRRVRAEMEQLALRSEVAPLAELADELRARVDEAALSVEAKADEQRLRHELFKIEGVVDEQSALLNTKADAAPTQQAHSTHAFETQATFGELKQKAEGRTQTIAAVEERLSQLTMTAEAKADRLEVEEMGKVNDNVQKQVAMLKAELQSTLTTLQTWVVESHNARKPHAIKYQQKQPRGGGGGGGLGDGQGDDEAPRRGAPGVIRKEGSLAQAHAQRAAEVERRERGDAAQQEREAKLARRIEQLEAALHETRAVVAQRRLDVAAPLPSQQQQQLLHYAPPAAPHQHQHQPQPPQPPQPPPQPPQQQQPHAPNATVHQHHAPPSAHHAAAPPPHSPLPPPPRPPPQAQPPPPPRAAASHAAHAAPTAPFAPLEASPPPVRSAPAGARPPAGGAPGQSAAVAAASAAANGGWVHVSGAPPPPPPPPSTRVAAVALRNASELFDASRAVVQLAAPPLAPRVAHEKRPGGTHAATTASLSKRGEKPPGAATREGDVHGPPFKSQKDRRDWLLQEKRRWIVEMRMAGQADATVPTAPIVHNTPAKLPAIRKPVQPPASLAHLALSPR